MGIITIFEAVQQHAAFHARPAHNSTHTDKHTHSQTPAQQNMTKNCLCRGGRRSTIFRRTHNSIISANHTHARAHAHTWSARIYTPTHTLRENKQRTCAPAFTKPSALVRPYTRNYICTHTHTGARAVFHCIRRMRRRWLRLLRRQRRLRHDSLKPRACFAAGGAKDNIDCRQASVRSRRPARA